MTNGLASSATRNRRRRISALTERSAAPDSAPHRRALRSVVIGVRRGGHVNGLVVEVGHFDTVGASQLEDLGGPCDTRQVRPVANFAAVALELGEKLFRQGDLVLWWGQPFVHDGTLVG